MLRSLCRITRAWNVPSVSSLILFFVLAGCATKPKPISSNTLERGSNWSVAEVVYAQADAHAFPVYTLPPDDEGDDAVARAIAWCADGRTPCCYRTPYGKEATCYQLAGKADRVTALGKWLREMLKRRKKGGTPPPRGENPAEAPPARSGKSPEKSAPEVSVPKRPGPGVGGNGTASEFGSLNGMSRADADAFLRSLGAEVKTTVGGYRHYKFPDKSEVAIRPNGEVIRIPKRIYGPDGRRINRGDRLDENGVPTMSHNTGERVLD